MVAAILVYVHYMHVCIYSRSSLPEWKHHLSSLSNFCSWVMGNEDRKNQEVLDLRERLRIAGCSFQAERSPKAEELGALPNKPCWTLHFWSIPKRRNGLFLKRYGFFFNLLQQFEKCKYFFTLTIVTPFCGTGDLFTNHVRREIISN